MWHSYIAERHWTGLWRYNREFGGVAVTRSKGYICDYRSQYIQRFHRFSAPPHGKPDVPTEKGIRQGDAISPVLFTAHLEEVFKTSRLARNSNEG